jgi:cell division transport system ATP-binding protein
MGFVLQDFKLLPHRTVFENVALPLIIRGLSSFEARRKVIEALRAVGMEHKQPTLASVLSAGEQQRACIARAIVNSPIILLADEPTGNLDTQTGDELFELLRKLNETLGTAFIIVTHNEKLSHQTDRLIHLQDGTILEDRCRS